MAQPASVRAGTATRRGGQATAKRILDSACDVLTARGREGFSMRSVAEAAGLHLANVQYYFPKRDDLIAALLNHIGERYINAYDEFLKGASDDPRERFSIILEYNLADVGKRETRQFFIQLWALLESLDDHSGKLLAELYETDIAQLGQAIALMHPEVAATEIKARATLLAAMIEGIMVVGAPHDAGQPLTQHLIANAHRIAMRIADGDESS